MRQLGIPGHPNSLHLILLLGFLFRSREVLEKYMHLRPAATSCEAQRDSNGLNPPVAAFHSRIHWSRGKQKKSDADCWRDRAGTQRFLLAIETLLWIQHWILSLLHWSPERSKRHRDSCSLRAKASRDDVQMWCFWRYFKTEQFRTVVCFDLQT